MTGVVLVLAALTSVRLALLARRGSTMASDWRTGAREATDALLLACAAVFLVVRPFAVQAFYVPSGSMRPTLIPEDRILVDKLSYVVSGPRRRDVVVFRAPQRALAAEGLGSEEEDFVKRIIALPGDTVEVRDSAVYVNGERQREAYTCDAPAYAFGPVTVPAGQLFVMGDNRNHSYDSHRWGTLDRRLVIGRVLLVFWPPARAGSIR